MKEIFKYFNYSNILTLFLIIIFYILGFHLSRFIDLYFLLNKKNYKELSDKLILFEIILEFSIALIIYKLFEYYNYYLLEPLYEVFNRKTPDYIYLLITLAFSFGIYKQLHTMNDKSKFLYEKYKNHFNKKYMNNKFYNSFIKVFNL